MQKYVVAFLVILLLLAILLCAMLYTKRGKKLNNSTLEQIRQNFIKIDPSYGDIPLYEGDSAYTENKSFITLCLKDPKTGEPYDQNVIAFVSLHELAHACSKSHGHGEEFREKFVDLLRRAARLGFYNPSKPIPSEYCGVDSSHSSD